MKRTTIAQAQQVVARARSRTTAVEHAFHVVWRDGERHTKSGLPRHGTRARYVSRAAPCRCARCTAANTAYIARYRQARATRNPGAGAPSGRPTGRSALRTQ